ncbi:hypothetical protein [Devosia sp. SL43]|uniref:hypothetical protein n=1 Tax=Devosia sp. SL43 TaxID=2806348 RepID=UPI001F17A857|nr:hypothetical protein [Devosia sp. SL43]UJW85720.1 hypothetical protein IM737_20445 [Devosia sp. SL43]
MAMKPIVRRVAGIGLLAGLSSIAMPAWGNDVLSGEWVGSYVCYQGLTALTLTIEPDGQQWSGVFAFGPDKDNKTVPRGAYELVITENDGQLHMEPGAWIEQPEGYVTVALDGAVSEDMRMLAGVVDFDGCTRFATERRTPLPELGKTK